MRPIATPISAAFSAGEVGHSPVFPGGEPCRCGSRGCLEVYASAKGIARRYEQATGEDIGAKAVDFGMTVTVQYQKDKPLKLTAENRPDAKVYRFPDLLDIFPKRGQVAVEKLIPPEDGQ